MIITQNDMNFSTCDIYKYFIVSNVRNYYHHQYNSYIIDSDENILSPATENCYLILDTECSEALFHWFAECAIFFPLFTILQNEYPNIKIVFKKYKDYHKLFTEYFNISSDKILYELPTNNNICFFPLPISALNENKIHEDYILYSQIFLLHFYDEITIEKDIDILILPRQNQNSNRYRNCINDCSDIINNLNNAVILNTDNITDINYQIGLIRRSNTVIVSDASPYMFNSLFAINSKIIVLGDIVISQTEDYEKMRYFHDIIINNNIVYFVPYSQGNYYNSKSIFLFDQIREFL